MKQAIFGALLALVGVAVTTPGAQAYQDQDRLGGYGSYRDAPPYWESEESRDRTERREERREFRRQQREQAERHAYEAGRQDSYRAQQQMQDQPWGYR
jgi:uncharacterized membrane protein YdbT with pleckstrin-like domain